MATSEMFQPELIDLHLKAETEVELFETIAGRLKELGYVNDGYLEGIKKREEIFPTGLITEYLNIALPHSDTQFVERPFIYIARIENPVNVHQMGDNQKMEVKDFLFLGIKEPSKQVGLLQELMVLFQKQAFVEHFCQASDSKEMFELFREELKIMEGIKNG